MTELLVVFVIAIQILLVLAFVVGSTVILVNAQWRQKYQILEDDLIEMQRQNNLLRQGQPFR